MRFNDGVQEAPFHLHPPSVYLSKAEVWCISWASTKNKKLISQLHVQQEALATQSRALPRVSGLGYKTDACTA